MVRRPIAAVGSLLLVAAITVAWWALALWPLPDEAAAWLARTRYVCFGAARSGLPDASGWLALTLQPALVFGILFAGWGGEVSDGLRMLRRSRAGRAGLAGMATAGVVALAAAGWRIGASLERSTAAFAASPPADLPRRNTPAPSLRLIDQHGDTATVERFRGRPVLVTFAYAHCQTVCPLVVRDVVDARRRLEGEVAISTVVVTLDPWRDIPSRLPHVAWQWGLGRDDFVLGGDIAEVEATLDAWNVARSRDMATGEVTHPRLVYVLDAAGRVAYVVNGGVDQLVELVRLL